MWDRVDTRGIIWKERLKKHRLRVKTTLNTQLVPKDRCNSQKSQGKNEERKKGEVVSL